MDRAANSFTVQTPRRLVLVADDYGLSPEVDAGILELADAGRLTGLGCLTQMPRWPEAARAISIQRPTVEIGVHLNLTQAFGAAWHRPLPQLIVQAYLGGLSRSVIAHSFAEQLDRFLDALGRAPDYVDGHQHVHQLPLVRDVLLETLDARGLQPWLRITAPLIPQDAGLKPWMIAHLGAPALGQTCRAQGRAVNPAFCGVYGFDRDEAGYLGLLNHWLACAPDGALMMCHPGEKAPVSRLDPIAQARSTERAALLSPAFDDLLRDHHRVLLPGAAVYGPEVRAA